MKKIFYPLVVFLLVYSCGIKETELKIKDIVAEKSISGFSDSIYFSEMQSLIWNNDRLLSSETKRSQVFVMDKDMQQINIIGKSGRRPKEMSEINHFYVYKDTIVIKDPGNDRMQFFDFNGNHLGYIAGLGTSPANYINRFVYEDSSFIASAKKDSAIIIHNYKTGNVKKIGQRYKFNSEKQDQIRNDRNILKKGSIIVSISDNQPIIESYDCKGNLLKKIDYSNIAVVKKELDYISKKNLPENSFVVVVADCNLYNDNILLLLNNHDEGFCSNIILEFIYDSDIKLCNIYRLPDKIYSSIAFNGTSLYAYSYTKGELQQFKL